MLEERIGKPLSVDGGFELDYSPFEIRTFSIEKDRQKRFRKPAPAPAYAGFLSCDSYFSFFPLLTIPYTSLLDIPLSLAQDFIASIFDFPSSM